MAPILYGLQLLMSVLYNIMYSNGYHDFYPCLHSNFVMHSFQDHNDQKSVLLISWGSAIITKDRSFLITLLNYHCIS